MNDLITISGVAGYLDENGMVFLKLEDVARGLGFTDNSKGTEYVRWNTITSYLKDIGFSQEVAKGSFIPENIFYRLAFKAKNETAELFQTMVADEILPAIRKNGVYMTGKTAERILTDPDFLIQLATQMKTEHTARMAAEQTITEQQPLVAFAQTCATSKDTILIRELAKIACKGDVSTGEKRLYQKLREWGLIFKGSTEPYQAAVDSG
jgi:prophage antirepressor-like protein